MVTGDPHNVTTDQIPELMDEISMMLSRPTDASLLRTQKQTIANTIANSRRSIKSNEPLNRSAMSNNSKHVTTIILEHDDDNKEQITRSAKSPLRTEAASSSRANNPKNDDRTRSAKINDYNAINVPAADDDDIVSIEDTFLQRVSRSTPLPSPPPLSNIGAVHRQQDEHAKGWSSTSSTPLSFASSNSSAFQQVQSRRFDSNNNNNSRFVTEVDSDSFMRLCEDIKSRLKSLLRDLEEEESQARSYNSSHRVEMLVNTTFDSVNRSSLSIINHSFGANSSRISAAFNNSNNTSLNTTSNRSIGGPTAPTTTTPAKPVISKAAILAASDEVDEEEEFQALVAQFKEVARAPTAAAFRHSISAITNNNNSNSNSNSNNTSTTTSFSYQQQRPAVGSSRLSLPVTTTSSSDPSLVPPSLSSTSTQPRSFPTTAAANRTTITTNTSGNYFSSISNNNTTTRDSNSTMTATMHNSRLPVPSTPPPPRRRSKEERRMSISSEMARLTPVSLQPAAVTANSMSSRPASSTSSSFLSRVGGVSM